MNYTPPMIYTLGLWWLMSLAAFRVTRLITDDTLTVPVRAWVALRFTGGRAAYFITCPWCVGAWISGAVVALVDWRTSVPLVALQVPAVMSAVGIIAAKAGA